MAVQVVRCSRGQAEVVRGAHSLSTKQCVLVQGCERPEVRVPVPLHKVKANLFSNSRKCAIKRSP